MIKSQRKLARSLRKQREIKTHQAVSSHFQKHGGQDDRTGGRRVGMRVGQPGVKREKRNLDRKSDRKRQEKQRARYCRRQSSSFRLSSRSEA